MNPLMLVREGGPLAMLAVALGVLGAIVGVIALIIALGKSRAGFGVGIVALVLAILTAGAGIAGTFHGRQQVDRALAAVESALDRERITRVGYREAQSASLIGVFAALVPLLFGAIGALAGARVAAQPARIQGLDGVAPAGSETSGRLVLAVVFTGIAALAASGAWVTAHRALPAMRFDFDENDRESWDLADSIESVLNQPSDLSEKERAHRIWQACSTLNDRLMPFWKADDLREWPRVMRRALPAQLSNWKDAANRCIELELKPQRTLEVAWKFEALMESPLLQDDGLKKQLEMRESQRVDSAPPTPAPTPTEDEAPPSSATLDRTEILKTIKGSLSKVRGCYERALVKNPKLEGKLVIEMLITGDGHVSLARAVEEPFPDQDVAACVAKVVKALRFPASKGGGVTTVKYPFVFKAAQ